MGVKATPPAFAWFGLTASGQRGAQAAAGSLQVTLTSTAGDLVASSLGRSPQERYEQRSFTKSRIDAVTLL